MAKPENSNQEAKQLPAPPADVLALTKAVEDAKKENKDADLKVEKDSFGKPIPVAPPKSVLADLPPPSPESSEGPMLDLSKAPPPLPELPVAKADPIAPPALPLPIPLPTAEGQVTALPEIKIEAAKPQQKTWKTTLAPSAVNPQTAFHYKRHLLPATIYRQEYAEPNRHLPKAIHRVDYENLLFESVVRNDVQTTRALLNAGAPVNSVATTGETPLAAARRAGATAAAQLLTARGGY